MKVDILLNLRAKADTKIHNRISRNDIAFRKKYIIY